MKKNQLFLILIIILYHLIMFYLSKTIILIDLTLTIIFFFVFLKMKKNERNLLKLILAVPLLIPGYILTIFNPQFQNIVDLWRYFAIICILFNFAFDYIDKWLVLHRAYLLATLIVVLELLGTIGFMKFETLSFTQGLWLTFISATTVGYGDMYANTLSGQIISVFIIIFGTLTYGALLIGFILTWLKTKEDQVRHEIIFKKNQKLSHEVLINNLFDEFRQGKITLSQLENRIIKINKKKQP